MGGSEGEPLRPGPDGLIPAVVQDRLTGQVRMVAYMNAEALRRTLETRRATFFSRSRGALWEKGETSGNRLEVEAVMADCDGDALLVLVDPVGPTCHTGTPSCFFHEVGSDGGTRAQPVDAASFLEVLERTIEARKGSSAAKSYTKQLLSSGALIGDKLREEAGELAEALAGEGDDRVAEEAADLVYHTLVGLASRGVPFREVLAVLARRHGQSGLVEKANRGK